MLSPKGRRLNPTRLAGWIALGFGAVHLVVAGWATRAEWSRVADQGWWNTVTLAEPRTRAEAERANAFWLTLGSFGAPMIAVGAHLLWATRHGHRVPRSVGWTLLAWGAPFLVVLPASPGWVVPLVGGLIVGGDNNRDATRGTLHHRSRCRRTAVTPRPARYNACSGSRSSTARGTFSVATSALKVTRNRCTRPDKEKT